MENIRKIKVGIILVQLFLLVGLCVYLWQKIKPTKIALVNFSGYKTAAMFDTVPGRFIQVDRVEWDDQIGNTLKKYDIILFQGMGMTVSEKQ